MRVRKEEWIQGYEANPKISCYNNLCCVMQDQHAQSPGLLHDSIPSQSHARREWRRKNTRGDNMAANHVFHTRISLIPRLLWNVNMTLCMWGGPGIYSMTIKIEPEFLDQKGNVFRVVQTATVMSAFNTQCV